MAIRYAKLTLAWDLSRTENLVKTVNRILGFVAVAILLLLGIGLLSHRLGRSCRCSARRVGHITRQKIRRSAGGHRTHRRWRGDRGALDRRRIDLDHHPDCAERHESCAWYRRKLDARDIRCRPRNLTLEPGRA